MNLIGTLQHLLSTFAGGLANARLPGLRHFLIWSAIKGLNIDLSESALQHFPSLNALFTRQLKSEARPIAPKPAVISPVDGTLSAMGTCDTDQLFTIKKHRYHLAALFGDHAELSQPFVDGNYALYYLAPHNYHRVHSPCDGQLTDMLSIPGQLYSVNEKMAPSNVFSRNERVIALFDVPGGKMAVIFIGALLVGSIHTHWAGEIRPSAINPSVHHQTYQTDEHVYQQGDDIGHFQFGSSILVLFSKDVMQWHAQAHIDNAVKMGESHGTILGKSS